MQIQIKCLDKFKPLITKRKRVKIIVGGRASTKTTFVADYLAACMSAGQLWCCGREFQNSIDESVHRTLQDEIHRLQAPGFSFGKTEIVHASGGRNFYRGLARNILSLKGILSGVDGLWVEEGEGLSEDTLRIMTASTRATAADFDAAKAAGIPLSEMKTPEIWITMNRGSRNDPIAKKYLARAEHDLERNQYYEDDEIMVVEANYNDMPREWFLASGLEDERQSDYVHLTRQQYEHKWLGKYLEAVDDAIIQPEWFDACIDAHEKLGFKPTGRKVVSHDPSDTGTDAKGLSYRHGSVFLDVQERTFGDVAEGCDWATDYTIQKQAQDFIWDGDGLGLGLRRQVADNFKGQPVTQSMFRGSEGVEYPKAVYQPIGDNSAQPVTNEHAFKNRRAQFYAILRDRMFRTYLAVEKGQYHDPDDMISFSSEIEHINALKAELCRIPRKPNGTGKFQVMSKDDMKRLLKIESPNMADAVMMSLAIPDKIVNTKPVIPPPIKPMGQRNGSRRHQRTR
jgi:phage terminase large subunit